MKMRIHRDGLRQLCITWQQVASAGGEKRAWVKEQTGENDWAKSGRYIIVARCNEKGNPAQGPDYPIRLPREISDREVLIGFVLNQLIGETITEFIDETTDEAGKRDAA